MSPSKGEIQYGPYRAFGAWLAQQREARRLSQPQAVIRAKAAHLKGITQGKISHLERGMNGNPEPDLLRNLAQIYQLPSSDVIGRWVALRYGVTPAAATRPEGPTNIKGFEAVPLISGRIAAGEPLVIEDSEFIGALAFREDFVSKRGEVVCVRVGPNEESMIPVINPGDVVVLETDPKKIQAIRADRIYAVRLDGGAMLKRLEIVKEAGAAFLACISDNSDKVKYKTRLLPIQESQSWLEYVIGEVVWRGQYVGGKR